MPKIIAKKNFNFGKKTYKANNEIAITEFSMNQLISLNEKGFINPLSEMDLKEISKQKESNKNKENKENKEDKQDARE